MEHNHSKRAPLLLLQLNYSIDLQAYYLQKSMWVDNMYVRIAEVTSTSDMQFKMLMAFMFVNGLMGRYIGRITLLCIVPSVVVFLSSGCAV